MPDSKSTVDEARKMLEKRRSELQGEIADVEKAITALGGKVRKQAGAAASRATGRRGRKPGRPRGSSTSTRGRGSTAAKSTGTAKRTRRKRKGGTRSDQAAKMVSDNPGLSGTEIATRLGIKPNYMYRVLGQLENEGRVRKDGRKYYPSK